MTQMAMTEVPDSYTYLHKYTKPVKYPEREIVGRDEEMRDILAAFERPELCNVILLADAGAGKGHPNDTLLPSPDGGYIKVGDIREGNRVYDEYGLPVNVIGVYPQGQKRVYRVTFKDGSSMLCNDEHILNVRNRYAHYEDKPYQNMTLRELMDIGIHDKQVRPDGRVGLLNHWYVPVGSPVQRSDVNLPIDPYVLGVLIGDGCLTDTVRTLEVSSGEESVIAEVAKRIGAIRYEKRKGCYSWIFLRDDSDGNHWYQQHDFADLSDDLSCVFGQYSRERRIPRIYIMGSVKQRTLLLQGLMDADGCVSCHDRLNVHFSTKSEGLAHDIQELAASLGMRTSLTSHVRDDAMHDDSPEYEVYFMVPVEKRRDLFYASYVRHDTFDVGMEQRVRRFNRYYDDMAIVDVEDLGYETEMTCIYVDSPTHLYLVGKEHIVTHNTALVQGTMMHDSQRLYLEVDLARMLAELQSDAIADGIKGLFGDAERYVRTEKHELVLFMDEFHQIVQLSAAAVEAMKPMLADSGTRGIRVIAATTYEEFRKYISDNQPLVERLMRINLKQPDEDTTVQILKGMAKRYGVENQFYNDYLFHQIYEYTNRYIPANSQPRKSILILDAMVGWHRLDGRKMDTKLLADVIYETEGVNVAFKVDAMTIKKRLDEKVLAQDAATSAIEKRMHICVAGLNNPNRPMSTFLFSGSTGVGKGLVNETLIPVYTRDGSVFVKTIGDLKEGDYVFNRHGNPVEVLGVFPRGLQDVYEVKFSDGRSLVTDSSHLWTYMLLKGKATANTYTNSTKELLERGVYTETKDGRHHLRYWIPMNEAVQYPEAQLSVHPYVMGSLIGNGCCTTKALTLSSADEDNVMRVASLLDGCGEAQTTHSRNYNWQFTDASGDRKWLATKDVFADYPEMIGCLANTKRIPDAYMTASIEQRWELIRGLFDTDGSITDKDGGRYNISYSTVSLELAEQIQHLLFSLGIASSVTVARNITRESIGNYTQYKVHVKAAPEDKPMFFWLPRKKKIADIAATQYMRKSRHKDFRWVGITDIVKLDVQKETTCIYVDDEEHLYQAGEFVVTHNTELTKQLAKILYDDERNLIRFDMTEYANADSLERFRDTLTTKVWERPYSIILLDEIEKACAPVTRLLLQVIDDGRLNDRNGRETSFVNAYIILTTNAGTEIYKKIAQYNESDTGGGESMKDYNALIRRSLSETTGDNRFPPELLGRIDVIVPFQPLSENTMRRIAKMKLKALRDEVMRKHNVDLKVEKSVIDYLVLDNLSTDSDTGGARVIASKLEAEVTTEVAKYINAHPDHNIVGVKVEGDAAYANKNKRVSDARVVVTGRV